VGEALLVTRPLAFCMLCGHACQHRRAIFCSVLQRVAVCCRCMGEAILIARALALCMLCGRACQHRRAVFCGVLRCVAVGCSGMGEALLIARVNEPRRTHEALRIARMKGSVLHASHEALRIARMKRSLLHARSPSACFVVLHVNTDVREFDVCCRGLQYVGAVWVKHFLSRACSTCRAHARLVHAM